VVGSAHTLNLPINGRRVNTFALLTPGLAPDGNDRTNHLYTENAGRTRITTQISRDAMQEFLARGHQTFAPQFGNVMLDTTTRDLNIGALGAEVSYRINNADGNPAGTFTKRTAGGRIAWTRANSGCCRWRAGAKLAQRTGSPVERGLSVVARDRHSQPARRPNTLRFDTLRSQRDVA
jgi:hypothetical protein